MGCRTKQDIQKCHLWSENVYFQKHLISHVMRIIHDENGTVLLFIRLRKPVLMGKSKKEPQKFPLLYANNKLGKS